MSPSRFWPFRSRKPHGPGAVAELGGAEASARNCDGARCGRTNGAGTGWLEGSEGTAPGEAEVDLVRSRPGAGWRDRVGIRGAGEAGNRQTEGVPEGRPAAATDWTMTGAQTQTPTHLPGGNRQGLRPCRRRDVNRSTENRTVPKPLDDRELACDVHAAVIIDLRDQWRRRRLKVVSSMLASRLLRIGSVSACANSRGLAP